MCYPLSITWVRHQGQRQLWGPSLLCSLGPTWLPLPNAPLPCLPCCGPYLSSPGSPWLLFDSHPLPASQKGSAMTLSASEASVCLHCAVAELCSAYTCAFLFLLTIYCLAGESWGEKVLICYSSLVALHFPHLRDGAGSPCGVFAVIGQKVKQFTKSTVLFCFVF